MGGLVSLRSPHSQVSERLCSVRSRPQDSQVERPPEWAHHSTMCPKEGTAVPIPTPLGLHPTLGTMPGFCICVFHRITSNPARTNLDIDNCPHSIYQSVNFSTHLQRVSERLMIHTWHPSVWNFLHTNFSWTSPMSLWFGNLIGTSIWKKGIVGPEVCMWYLVWNIIEHLFI
jgi:hypothetical protein